MAPSTKQQLSDIGKRLAAAPHSKDAILKSLKEAARLLSELEQSPDLNSTLQHLTRALIHPHILRHKDKEVRLVAITCIMEIARIFAPSAPYTDEELKEIFQLVVSNLQQLDEIAMPAFARLTTILEIMAKFKICVLMLDMDCDDLILEMFQTFFTVISEKHPTPIQSAMQTIMVLILEESEEISQPLLELLLCNLLKEKKCQSPAAHMLAVSVIGQCANKLELHVKRFLTSIMLEGKASESELRDNYHDVIYEIYKCAPQMLLAVIPNLAQELVSDKVDIRLKAVQLLGRLFALPGQHIAKEYKQIFAEFLRRFADKVLEVRLAMVNWAKECLKENPSGHESAELLSALCDRILDNEDKVRVYVVNAICDLAMYNLKCISVSLIKQVSERLRDKKVVVRKEALQKLVEVYRTYCTKFFKGEMETEDSLELIPSKMVRCCFDKEVKDFRPAGIEIIFSEELFAAELPVGERAKHWMLFYTNFDENDKKALAKMLFQKRRLQTEMSEYLSLRQKLNAQHNQDFKSEEVQRLFRSMSSLFIDDLRTEEGFQKLHLMKDKSIFKSFTELLDPNASFSKSQAIIDDLLHRIGQNHSQLSFIKQLAIRCSFRLFGKDHIKAVVQEIHASENAGNKDLVVVGLSLLSEFTGFAPLLIEAVKDELLHLLMDGDEAVKERVAEILAKAGGLRGQIGESSSPIEFTLQNLCLEGSRKQAKFAITALTAINTDSGFKSLSLLYARLLNSMTENNPCLPTVLQSLACIAQNCPTIFETREDDIIRFVVRKLLRKDSDSKLEEHDELECGWENSSTSCKLKMFGLKMLVKSFVPTKEHIRKRLMGLLGVLSTILSSGEISEEVKSSEIDKAHLRLAAAKGVLRLARHLDVYIPPEIFRACLFTSQDSSRHVRCEFLCKIHQYLKDRTLNHKYACAFALYTTEASKEILRDAKHYLSEFIQVCHREGRLRTTSMLDENDTTPIIHYPEYVLVYLVHILAHHPKFPIAENASAEAYEPFYRILFFYIYSLLGQESNGSGNNNNVENYAAIQAILRTVKKAEDGTKNPGTEPLHIVCDLGLAIMKEIGRYRLYSESFSGVIPLPSLLYKLQGGNSFKDDGSDLPLSLIECDAISQFWSKSTQLWQTLNSHVHKGSKRVAVDCSLPPITEKNGRDKPSSKQRSKLQEPKEEQKRRTNKNAHQEESTSLAGRIGNRILRSLNEERVSLENPASLKQQESSTPSRRQTRRSKETTIDANLQDPGQDHIRSAEEVKHSTPQHVKPASPELEESHTPKRQTRRSLEISTGVNRLDQKQDVSTPSRRQTRRSVETNVDANSLDPGQEKIISADDIKTSTRQQARSASFKEEQSHTLRREIKRLIEINTGFSPLDKSQYQTRFAEEVNTSIQHRIRSPAARMSEGNEASTSEDLCNSEIAGEHLQQEMKLRSKVEKRLNRRKQNNQNLEAATKLLVANRDIAPEMVITRSAEKKRILSVSPDVKDEQSFGTSLFEAIEVKSHPKKSKRGKLREKLVGSRIKVWSQEVHRFCAGSVESFDPKRNIHKLVYDDGKIAWMQLDNEQWDILEEDSAVINVKDDSSNQTAFDKGRPLKRGRNNSHIDISPKEVAVAASSGETHGEDDSSSQSRYTKSRRNRALTRAVNTDRVLRSRDVLGISDPENTALLSDEEPTTTWRSRRRKV